MQVLNHLKWLKHVVKNLGGTPPVTQCALVGPNNCIKLKISFDIPVRGHLRSSMSSEPVPMVSIVGWGTPSLVRRTFERTAVQACLEQLNANGYFVPDYSYFLIKALEEGESVITTAKRLCRLNEHDMVWRIGISFCIILFQLVVVHFLIFVTLFLTIGYLWSNHCGNELSCNSRASDGCCGIFVHRFKCNTHKRLEVPVSSFIFPAISVVLLETV